MKDGRFEVGDRVRVKVDNGYDVGGVVLVPAREYNVTSVDTDGNVNVDNGDGGYGGWSPTRFQLVEPDNPERDATPDEAYEFGTVDGYDEVKREDEDGWWDVDTIRVVNSDSLDEIDAYGLQVRVQVRRKLTP